jgi:PAS domain S-box-containing protein
MPTPTGHERTFSEDEIIVSKTDLTGRITYANEVFIHVCGYSETELLGAPHSIIRHPDMPRCVFKLAWDRIQAGAEIFAYVMNMAKNGDHYWVFAHLTPTFNTDGRIIGYHSNRRVPDERGKGVARSLYAGLLAEERRHPSKERAIQASTAILVAALAEKKASYDELVWSI